MAEDAREHLSRQIVVLERALPADVMTRRIEDLAPADALGRGALSGLHQLIRIVEQPLDMSGSPEALKQQRLIGDMAVAGARLYMRAAEGAFKPKQSNTLITLLEALKDAQGKQNG